MTDTVQPRPGMVLQLRDSDYRYGSGPLTCEVIAVVAGVQIDGLPGWHLRAYCTSPNPGFASGRHERELYVLSSAVRPRRPHAAGGEHDAAQ